MNVPEQTHLPGALDKNEGHPLCGFIKGNTSERLWHPASDYSRVLESNLQFRSSNLALPSQS